MAAIIEHAHPDHRTAIALDAATGLRASEVSGLRWSDVELDGGEGTASCPGYAHLHVRGSVQRVDSTLVRTPPKSKRGVRFVPLADSVVEMLRRHRAMQVERRLAIGPAWSDGDVVFDHGAGQATDPAEWGVAFRAAARSAKIRGVSFHSLRHTWVTRAVEGKFDAGTVSRLAGHASTAFTLDRYYHPSEEMAAPLADVVEAELAAVLNGI